MFRKLFTRRRGVVLTTVALGVSGMTLALTGGAAGAATPASSALNGSGSETTFQVMSDAGLLYSEDTIGCNLGGGTYSSGTQPLDLSCTTPYLASLTISGVSSAAQAVVTTTAVANNIAAGQTVRITGVGGATNANGFWTVLAAPAPTATTFAVGANTSSQTYTSGGTVSRLNPAGGENGLNESYENPYNDVTYQEPAIGSGNGLDQLQGLPNTDPSTTNPTLAISYARSSSGVGSASTPAQNYIAYAEDGISWVHFTKLGAVATDSAAVTTMSQTQLQEIYANTLQCAPGGGPGTGELMNWQCLGGANAPIACYMAQAGSGTEATFRADETGGSDTPPCTAHEPDGTQASHTGLFENEVSSLVAPGDPKNNGDASEAIYFFSYGRYSTLCLAGHCPGATADTAALGQLSGGSGVCAASCAVDQATIQGTTGGGVHGPWPIFRYIYNIYNNALAGTVTDPAPATPATQGSVNLVSEYGYLCRPETATDIDPLTLVSYRSEIETGIKHDGFFPIDVSPTVKATTTGKGKKKKTTYSGGPFNEGSLGGNGAASLVTDPNYQFVMPTSQQSLNFASSSNGAKVTVAGTVLNPAGYCLDFAG
ncbi:MAG: hypothetical protein ACLQPH_12560 [Acidimicrobiales bacterium]